MSQPLLDFEKVRERLDAFEFGRLFIEELGWSNPPVGRPSTIDLDGAQWTIRTIAQLGGVAVIEVQNSEGAIPDASTERKLHREPGKNYDFKSIGVLERSGRMLRSSSQS